jgi:type II secretory pathway pseudopilin PulG
VVVAIIGMLMSILLPSLSRARQQAASVQCLAQIRELGRGMVTYQLEYGNYPAHQWRLPDGSRIRWFNALVETLGEINVQVESDDEGNPITRARPDVRSCPSTPDWEVGRNNSYGYNYKYVGSSRDNILDDNPYRPFETFPVKDIPVPSKTIAFADCDGTG